MGLPRSKYVRDGEIGVYHCTSRCVRRAFLSGYDAYSGRDYSHRKAWIEDRLHQLASIFAVDISSFSVLSNHYHVTLRTRPDIAAGWSDYEVARRWLILCPIRYRSKKKPEVAVEEHINALAVCRERIAELRQRLSSLSWFMGRLNEYIARAANKEDKVKGRFWESRFKCQVLLDDAAIAACMVYVDLNPIRSSLAASPENSDFTSIQLRIRAYRKEMKAAESNTQGKPGPSTCWLCPVSSLTDTNGILPMTETEYFDLVDRTGRLIRRDKRGAIGDDLGPILQRIGVRPESWSDTVSKFEDKFRLAAGLLPNLRDFAKRMGQRWFTGVHAAQASFI
ncbi:MAG: transposase [Acidobacteriota bacterium]|jgi:putative transposase